LKIPAQISAAVIFLIWALVFTVGFFSPDWLGPYGTAGDVLHLLILAGVLTFTWLAFVFVYGRGGKRT